tara:strand:+ start:1852 stop:2208 length:357 start_codon:yes stop_codon:yes gene_type:complete
MGISKNFRRSEFKCRCGHCDFDTVDTELVVVLQVLRDQFKSPVKITSGNRCPEYNNLVGGSRNSQHIKGRAADIQVKDVSPVIVQDYLKKAYSGRFGIGSYALFTHIDTRTTTGRWDG